jgi:flavin-dependent dehydrogenase
MSLDDAAGRLWDVIVIGAGPAGALAAREVAKRNLRVLVVDKSHFPRWKVCGCCLNRRTLSMLDSVGLGRLPDELGAVPLTGVHLAADGRKAALTLPAGVALSRSALDAALVQAAIRSGAAFLPSTSATLGACTPEHRCVLLRQAGEPLSVSGRVILAADGLGGAFLSRDPVFESTTEDVARIGAGVIVRSAPAAYQSGTIYMACGKAGYVGLVRLETGELDVAAAFDPSAVRKAGGVGPVGARILAEAQFPAIPNLENLAWRGTPLLRRRALRPAAERAFAIGDAARFVEPFTGDGIAWALASGVAVAPLAHRASQQWTSALASRWSQRYRRTVGRRQRVSWVIAEVVRRPRWIRAAIRLLSRTPKLAWPIVRFLNVPLTSRRCIA